MRSPEKCTLYIWPAHQIAAPGPMSGHIALKTTRYYVSHRPTHCPRNRSASVEKRSDLTLEKDKSELGSSPTVVDFYTLDVKAMEGVITQYRKQRCDWSFRSSRNVFQESRIVTLWWGENDLCLNPNAPNKSKSKLSPSESSQSLILKILIQGGIERHAINGLCMDPLTYRLITNSVNAVSAIMRPIDSFLFSMGMKGRSLADTCALQAAERIVERSLAHNCNLAVNKDFMPLLQLAKNGESVDRDAILAKVLEDPSPIKNIYSDDAFALSLIQHLDDEEALLVLQARPPAYLEGKVFEANVRSLHVVNTYFLQHIKKFNDLRYVTLIKLNLAGSRIVEITPSFVKCIKSLEQLHNLCLADNGITYAGAMELSNGLKEHRSLKVIDLSNNHVGCEATLLPGLNSRFSRCATLEEICINGNFFGSGCEDKLLTWPEPTEEARFRYGLFSSCAKSTKSVLSPQSKDMITPMTWMICLACRKGEEHSMIFLEGMRQSGQRFLERYDLRAASVVGQASVKIEPFDPAFFRPENYYCARRSISEAQGTVVRQVVERDSKKSNGIPFSKTCSNKKSYNCLTWSKRIFAAVHIKTAPALLPSVVSRKGFG